MTTPLLQAARVSQSCSATGTSNLSLLAPLSQFQGFADAFEVGDQFTYCLQDGNGIGWEIGRGTLVSSTELSRDYVYSSSASSGFQNNLNPAERVKINLSSNSHRVYNTIPPELFVFLDADGEVTDPTPFRKVIFKTIDAMVAEEALPATGETTFCIGKTTINDGRGGLFRWDAADATAPDDIDTFRNANSATGLYKRVRVEPAPVLTFATTTALRAEDAAALYKSGRRALVLGRAAEGDRKPFHVLWDPASTATHDGATVFRPTTGAASSGAGRWLRTTNTLTQAFTSGDATPSIAGGEFFTTAGATAITDFDDAFEGQEFEVIRGDSDIVITHNASLIDCGGESITLSTSLPRVRFCHVGGVHKLIGQAVHGSWRALHKLDLAKLRTLHVLRGAENVIPFDPDWTGGASSHDAVGEMLTTLNTQKHGIVEFKPDSIVSIFPAYNSTAFPELTGLRNVKFRFRGAKLITPATATENQTFFPFWFDDDNEGITIDDVRLEWSNLPAPADAHNRGPWWFHFHNAGKSLKVGKMRARGGFSPMSFGRDSDPTKRWENIEIGLIHAFNCGRGLRAADNGDDLIAHMVYADRCGRPMLAHNWRGLIKANVVERDSSSQLNISNESVGWSTYNGEATSGALDLNHVGLAPTGISGLGEAYRIALQLRGEGAAVIDKWSVKSRSRLDPAGPATQGGIQIAKYKNNGSVDDTASRGHSGAFQIDQRITGAPASTTVSYLMADAASVGDFSGESGLEMDAKVVTRGSSSASAQVRVLAQVAGGPKVRVVADLDGTLARTGTPAAGYREDSQDASGTKHFFGASPLGTGAFATVGTSGDALGKLNVANVFSASQSFTGGGDSFSKAGGAVGLTIRGDTASSVTQERSGDNAGAPNWGFNKSRGAYLSRTNVLTGDQLGVFNFNGYADGGFRSGANIAANVIAGTPSSTDMQTEVAIQTSGAGSVTPANALRIRQTLIRPGADNTATLGESATRFSAAYAREVRPGDGAPIWTSGVGTPEGAVTAPIASLYTRTDGGAGTTLYVKESGSGNTGWVAK